MKGVILAAGKGTRLLPLTLATNKHLLPVYDKPMIFYPLQTLIDAGIKDIMVIVDSDNVGAFLRLLGSGAKLGVNISYRIQDESKGVGIAAALWFAEDFCKNEKIAVVLGDNIFEGSFKQALEKFEKQKEGACIFLKEVKDPERFGIAEVNNGKVISIEEKPKKPKSNLAVTGVYLYDCKVFDIIRTLKPSARGELEITDVNNAYLSKGLLNARNITGFWSDAGTFDSLHKASTAIKEKNSKE